MQAPSVVDQWLGYRPGRLPCSDPCGFDGSAASSPDFAIASYLWDFGDGQTQTSALHTGTAATKFHNDQDILS